MRHKLTDVFMLIAASLPLLLGCKGQSEQPRRSDEMPEKKEVSSSQPSPPLANSTSPPSLSASQASPGSASAPDAASRQAGSTGRELATLGAGCFWCVEAVFEQLDGVLDVSSGYMGGTLKNPTYEDVCSGTTGHAEVVQVAFDPAKISYEKLLEWFWKLHDPTTLNRQGNDVGTQYRSAIFYHSEEQRIAAEAMKKRLGASGAYHSPIVTEITKAGDFYKAEDYHQEYYRLNKRQPYCRFIITPKLEKLGLEK